MSIWETIKSWFVKPTPPPPPVAPRENKRGEVVKSEPPPEHVEVPPVKTGTVHYDKWMYPGLSKFVADPDPGVPFPTLGNVPKGIVLHHTCSYKIDSTLQWFKNEAVDVHFLVDQNGQVVQMVPCNRKAAHAGVSEWKGFHSLNNWFLGIEVVNIGPLKKINGKFFDYYGREWKGAVRERDVMGYKYWEPFTASAEEAVLAICEWACKVYDIPVANVIAHFEAAPDRKNDPAGGFSYDTMDKFRAALQARIDKDVPMAFV